MSHMIGGNVHSRLEDQPRICDISSIPMFATNKKFGDLIKFDIMRDTRQFHYDIAARLLCASPGDIHEHTNNGFPGQQLSIGIFNYTSKNVRVRVIYAQDDSVDAVLVLPHASTVPFMVMKPKEEWFGGLFCNLDTPDAKSGVLRGVAVIGFFVEDASQMSVVVDDNTLKYTYLRMDFTTKKLE